MGEYDDIILHPHHVSTVHARMSLLDRAAQFSPFAALTGYDEAVTETARFVDQKLVLDEEQKQAIDNALRIGQGKTAVVVFFEPDDRKLGGSYETLRGVIQRIDPYTRSLLLEGKRILFDDVYSIAFQD